MVRLISAALSELVEETGIRPEHVVPLRDQPLHIDVHPIPANDAKGEPAHQHIDFRFLFGTSNGVTELQAELEWSCGTPAGRVRRHDRMPRGWTPIDQAAATGRRDTGFGIPDGC
ncbi:hypothetical protein [Kitasatospora sp. GP82]|uniref:hypothetical protein n=1 Tax=Kitasatospora sp. GP82 TaxID=3035089 RepID=UPI0032AFDEC0